VPFLPSSAAEDPSLPGLPLLEGGQWHGGKMTGRSEAVRAKQWLHVPATRAVAFVDTARRTSDPSCRTMPPYQERRIWAARVFFASPEGSSTPYGQMAPFVVRTVAFGSVPVEATVQLRQPRDAEGLPEPIRASVTNYTFCDGRGPFGAARETFVDAGSFRGELDLRITRLRVDGVVLPLDSLCTTSVPAALTLRSRAYNTSDPSIRPEDLPASSTRDTTPYWAPIAGGLLQGTLDIPPFEGCTSVGDDLSPLLTGLVSGTDNPVDVRISGISSSCGPGRDDCTYPRELDLPSRLD